MRTRLDAPEETALAEAFLLGMRYILILGPVVALLAAIGWLALSFATGADDSGLPLYHYHGISLRSAHQADRLPAFAASVAHALIVAVRAGLPIALLYVTGMLIGFIVAAVALRQLTRSDHLSLGRLIHALESELWPMIKVAFYILRRRLLIVLICFGIYLGVGVSPVGGLGLVFDLPLSASSRELAGKSAVIFLCLLMFYHAIPFLFLSYQVLFHNNPPHVAEGMIRTALQGHRGRMYLGLLVSLLPYLLVDQFLFYFTDWHPLLRRIAGGLCTIPAITVAYLYYARLELLTMHPGRPANA